MRKELIFLKKIQNYLLPNFLIKKNHAKILTTEIFFKMFNKRIKISSKHAKIHIRK